MNVDEENTVLLEISECGVCCRQMDSKIFICPNGHDICERCFKQLKGRVQCPTCRVGYAYDSTGDPTRNRSLERLIAYSRLPCPHASVGCEKVAMEPEMRHYHAKKCSHQLLKCPFGVCHTPDDFTARLICQAIDCNVGLPLDDLLKHALDKHKIDTFCSNEIAFQFELDDMTDGEGHWRMFLKKHDDKGCVYCKPNLSPTNWMFGNTPKTGEFCPNMKCVLLMGYKNAQNEITLCVRTLLPGNANEQYRIEVDIPQHDSIVFESKLRNVDEQLGLESKYGECLTLSTTHVTALRNLGPTTSTLEKNGTVMKIFI
jgi:hypothetical protein